MAVPADIRAVERPVNTIVEDSGHDGPKRYAVRQRSKIIYVAGKNPQPRNGKVIGHIIDHKFVPLQDSSEEKKTPNQTCFLMEHLPWSILSPGICSRIF